MKLIHDVRKLNTAYPRESLFLQQTIKVVLGWLGMCNLSRIPKNHGTASLWGWHRNFESNGWRIYGVKTTILAKEELTTRNTITAYNSGKYRHLQTFFCVKQLYFAWMTRKPGKTWTEGNNLNPLYITNMFTVFGDCSLFWLHWIHHRPCCCKGLTFILYPTKIC